MIGGVRSVAGSFFPGCCGFCKSATRCDNNASIFGARVGVEIYS